METACLTIDQARFSSNYCKKINIRSSNLNHVKQPGPPGLTAMAAIFKITIVLIVEHDFYTKHLVTTSQRFTRNIPPSHDPLSFNKNFEEMLLIYSGRFVVGRLITLR